MNLIEQLGGYEKAKHELELKEQGSILQCCAAVTADMIREALLEYRRAHNIYEVGDNILYGVLGSEVVKYEEWMNNGTCIRHATDAEIEAGHRL